MKTNRTLIVGKGEIGKSLERIFSKHYETDIIDKGEISQIKPEIMHIAFPYSNRFEEFVNDYQQGYKPDFTVIHSTVPVGVSKRLDAIHSPVIGIHPHLEESIKTFTKYLSGPKASEVAQYFRRAGIKVYLFPKQETTELAKIASTTFYATMIEYVKELNRTCEKKGLSFTEVYTLWTDNYNKGYQKLGHPEYTRPNLVPIMTKQNGHCTIPNLELWNNEFTELIKKMNDKDG